MLFLWQIYVDSVDPFMKILHVPTMGKVFRELRGKHHTLGPSMHALVHAISLAAVMSLEDEEVSSPTVNSVTVIRLIHSVIDSCQLQH